MCGRRARTVAPTPARASRALAPAPIVNEEFQIVAVDDALNGNGGDNGKKKGKGTTNCLGCQRSALTGIDFVDPAQALTWHLEGSRGSWCRPCFRVWYICYRDQVRLAEFSDFLRSSAATLAVFMFRLAASSVSSRPRNAATCTSRPRNSTNA